MSELPFEGGLRAARSGAPHLPIARHMGRDGCGTVPPANFAAHVHGGKSAHDGGHLEMERLSWNGLPASGPALERWLHGLGFEQSAITGGMKFNRLQTYGNRSRSFRSSAVTSTFSPSSGTCSLSVQTMPWATIRRYDSCCQFLWKCRPLKPKDRPLSGRSQAHATG